MIGKRRPGAAHPLGPPARPQARLGVALASRRAQVEVELEQRDEDEAPREHLPVRQREAVGDELDVAEQQDVDVDRARAVARAGGRPGRARARRPCTRPAAPRARGRSRSRRQALRNWRLVEDLADGVGVVGRRAGAAHRTPCAGSAVDRRLEVRAAVADVRSRGRGSRCSSARSLTRPRRGEHDPRPMPAHRPDGPDPRAGPRRDRCMGDRRRRERAAAAGHPAHRRSRRRRRRRRPCARTRYSCFTEDGPKPPPCEPQSLRVDPTWRLPTTPWPHPQGVARDGLREPRERSSTRTCDGSEARAGLRAARRRDRPRRAGEGLSRFRSNAAGCIAVQKTLFS